MVFMACLYQITNSWPQPSRNQKVCKAKQVIVYYKTVTILIMILN